MSEKGCKWCGDPTAEPGWAHSRCADAAATAKLEVEADLKGLRRELEEMSTRRDFRENQARVFYEQTKNLRAALRYVQEKSRDFRDRMAAIRRRLDERYHVAASPIVDVEWLWGQLNTRVYFRGPTQECRDALLTGTPQGDTKGEGNGEA